MESVKLEEFCDDSQQEETEVDQIVSAETSLIEGRRIVSPTIYFRISYLNALSRHCPTGFFQPHVTFTLSEISTVHSSSFGTDLRFFV